MGSQLFPGLEPNLAYADEHRRSDVKENCKTEPQDNATNIRDELFNNTKIGKNHPQFKVNKTSEIKVKGQGNNPDPMVKVQSPFGKMISEKQKDNEGKFRSDITVNCHKLLNATKTDVNGTHTKYQIKTFTSVKISPTANFGQNKNHTNEQSGWGPVTVKSNGTINAPDMGLNLTKFNSTLGFATAEVFWDSNTNTNYNIGEYIYSNVTDDTKIDTSYLRQFANYENLPLNEFVDPGDPDDGKTDIEFFNATVMYYDQDSSGHFNATETVYLDTEPFGVVSENDIRLANAKFVGNFTDPDMQFMDGKKVNIANGIAGMEIYQTFIEECNKEGMGFYNYTTDTCDYTKRYGMQMEKMAKDKGFEIKFKNKGPDVNRKLLAFNSSYVYVDKNNDDLLTNGTETIYLQKPGNPNEIDDGDIRMANAKFVGSEFADGSVVIKDTNQEDPDVGESVKELEGTMYKFYDADGDKNFSIGETVYLDREKPQRDRVDGMGKGNNPNNMGDLRIVNSKSVGNEFDDGSEVYKNGMFEDMSMGCDGNGNPNNQGNKKCPDLEIGFEERQYNVTEDLELMIANNATDSPDTMNEVIAALAEPLSLHENGLNENGQILRTFEKDILFGDTVVPHVRFGFGINLETCFWIFGCLTWFKIGVWFTPYIITGFRLPGRVTGYGIPDKEFASKSFDFDSNFDGFDASYQKYYDICDENPIGQAGGTFGDDVFPTCEDFASYDALSIPTVIKEFSDLDDIFDQSGCSFDIIQGNYTCDFSRLPEAPGEFIKVATILFNPLPPKSVPDLASRISGAYDGTVSPAQVKDFVEGQEIVLKAGVIIEVELVILNIEILDIRQDVRIDLLGLIQGFLLYNEIVKSSNPIVYNGKYAIQPKLTDNICKLSGIHEKCFEYNDLNGTIQCTEIDATEQAQAVFVAGWIGANQAEYKQLNYTLPECKASPHADYKAIWDLITSYENMKEAGVVFTSFETPYGLDDEGSPIPFPYLGPDVAGIPVISNKDAGYNILYLRGNCLAAFNDGQILKIPAPYGPLPFCSLLWAPGFAEAILGIKAVLSSLKVDAELLRDPARNGDAALMPDNSSSFGSVCPTWDNGTDTNAYNIPANIEARKDWKSISYCAFIEDDATSGTLSSNVTRTITVDNFDGSPNADEAKIIIDNFMYNLQLVVQGDLLINFEDPVKFFLPDDYKSVKINLFTEDIPTGIGIGQHPGIEGFGTGEDEGVFVINYAVGIENDGDPINQPNGTKPIREDVFVTQPDKRSNSTVTYTNIGNDFDKIHELLIEFPELSSDNPGIQWVSIPNQTTLDTMSFNLTNNTSQEIVFGINPPRHWSTAPSYEVGYYNVTVYGTSSNATKYDMPAKEPVNGRGEGGLGAYRINATDILQINVTQFGAPTLNFTEPITQTKPGGQTDYNSTVSNFGNGPDIIPFSQKLVDSNTVKCDLFDKGPDNLNCPYRAEFTALQNEWTSSAILCNVFWKGVLPCDDVVPDPTEPLIPPNSNDTGYTTNSIVQQYRQFGLEPTEFRTQNFTTVIPPNWAGIDDTVYKIRGIVNSTADPEEYDLKYVEHTVIATKESSIRYLGLEINSMKDKVILASVPDMIDKGSQSALSQILDKAIEGGVERALETVCMESRKGPNNTLESTKKILDGLIKAIEGMSPKNINQEFADELISNALSTMEDIEKTISNNESSEVACEDDFGKGGPEKVKGFIDSSEINQEPTENADKLDDTNNDSHETNAGIPIDENEKNDLSSEFQENQESLIDDVQPEPLKEKSTQPNLEIKKTVPLWIKNNAGWWAEEKIKDSDFVLGIQYLIQQKVIDVDASSQVDAGGQDKIPEWIKNNAGWWAEDMISEAEFLNGVKYLVEQGIVQIANS